MYTLLSPESGFVREWNQKEGTFQSRECIFNRIVRDGTDELIFRSENRERAETVLKFLNDYKVEGAEDIIKGFSDAAVSEYLRKTQDVDDLPRDLAHG